MSLDTTLLSVLADPVDHQPLDLDAGALVNRRTARRYPVRDDVPVLLTGHDGAPASFDGVATWYDEVMLAPEAHGPLTALVNEAVAAELGPGPGTVLDVACGTGLSVRWLAPLGWSVLGLDYSADQLSIARHRLPVVQGDAGALPVQDASLDATITTFSAAPDQVSAAHEVARVLRPGGVHVAVFVHPVLNGGAAELRPDGTVLVGAGYPARGVRAPSEHATSIRGRVGSYHEPLDARLGAFLAAGLRLRTFAELSEVAGALPTSVLTTWTKA